MNFQAHHDEYCHQTGLHLRYMPLEHDSDWYSWAKVFGKEDLKTVVDYLRKKYKDRPDILRNTLMFRHLIRSRDYFAEYLAEAEQEARKPKATERTKVLAATGRQEKKPDGLRTIGEVLDGSGLVHAPVTPQAGAASPAPAISPEAKAWMEEHNEWKKRQKP